MSAVLDEAGFTSVVATNCEQEYHRYLRLGEQVTVRASLESVTGPKRTALGEGWFVTTRSTWYAGTEPVASMLFRVLKFRPARGRRPARARGRPAGDVLRPAGLAGHRVLLGRAPPPASCGSSAAASCGALRHPPGPMCPALRRATGPGTSWPPGTGEVYSYVVQHHPPVPGKQLPIVVALVAAGRGRADGRRAARHRARTRCASGCRSGSSSSGWTTS